MRISTTGPDGSVFVPVIDTSAWQFPEYDSKRGVLRPGAVAPDLTAARDKGVAGIIHRVSNGLTADPSYELTIAAAVDAGLEHGAYSYLQPGRSAADVQARRVLELIARGPASTLPVMADCEHFDGEMDMSPDEFAAWLRVWLDIVAEGTGRQPIIYTASWWWNRESTVGFELWDSILARYPAQSPHRPQESWAPSAGGSHPLGTVGLREGPDGSTPPARRDELERLAVHVVVASIRLRLPAWSAHGRQHRVGRRVGTLGGQQFPNHRRGRSTRRGDPIIRR